MVLARLVLALAASSCAVSPDDHVHDGVAPTTVQPITEAVAPARPEIPLESWMKGELMAELRASDCAALARSLEQLAGQAPPGFVDWATIAQGGAAAATRHDLDGVRQACATCHRLHRRAYRGLHDASPPIPAELP